jgi:hypothetical protein
MQRFSTPTFDPQNDEAPYDEAGRYHGVREQMRFDGTSKQQAQDHSRHKSNEHIQDKTPRQTLSGQCNHRAFDFLPVHKDDGEDGAGLDGDVKHLGFFIVKTQQGTRQNKVTGGRDGQKFGQTLDHTHDSGFQKQHEIHDVSF